MLPRGAVALSALLLLVAGCVTPGSAVDPAEDALGPSGTLITGVQSLVHSAGDNLTGRAADGIAPATFLIGHDAGEPTLGVTKEGVLFFAASTFENDVAGQGIPLPRTDILRSLDGGATWEDVTPYLPGGLVRSHPETGDPMVYVDVDTGRVFDIDQRLGVTCYTVTYSDDDGKSWTGPFPACQSPPADHQTIVTAKPRLLPTAGYAKIVYVCYNQIATTTCVRSLDGGMTFAATGPVGSKGVQPENADPELSNPDFLCSALVGHMAADSTGVVYLPRRECSTPKLAITKDDGMSWQLVTVSDVPAYNCGGTCGMDPAVTVDAADNVHYVFQGADGHMYLTTSTDQGATWSPAVDILAPGLTVANLATVAGGDDGRLAIAYVASSVSGGYDATDEDVEKATWDAYLALVTDATTGAPVVTTTRLNPADDPLVRGPCGPGRCNNPGLTDFIDVVVDADGRAWVALVDNCMEKCASAEGTAEDSTAAAGFVGTLATGPSLRANVTALPPIHGAAAGHEH